MSIKKTLKKVARQSKTKKKPAKLSSGKSSGVAKPSSAQSLPAGRQGYGVAKKKVVKKPAKKIKKTTSAKVSAKKAVKKQQRKSPSPKVTARRRKKSVKKTTRKPTTKKTTKKVSKTKNAKTEKSASAKRSGVAKKKRTVSPRKKSNKRIFVTVTEEKYFWVNNGPVLKDLRDLYKALKTINKDQFIYHAHGDNNDFALWVEYVLLDKECAKALTKAKTQKATVKKVSEVLKKYK